MLNTTHHTHRPRSRWQKGTTWVLLGMALALLGLTGCENVDNQPRLDTYSQSAVFGSAARPIRAEAVASGYLGEDEHLNNGTVGGQLATTFPYPLTGAVLARGQSLYNDFCAHCHGYNGSGDGVIAREGMPQPATYHSDDLRASPVGYLFQVITNGKGYMFSYASRIQPEDRWAIVAYVKALQLSQYAPFDSLPPDIQEKIRAR